MLIFNDRSLLFYILLTKLCVWFAVVAALRDGSNVLSGISGLVYSMCIQRCAQVRQCVGKILMTNYI